MKAVFKTTCHSCDQEIKRGTEIEQKNGFWIHAVCPDLPGKTKKTEQKKPTEEKPELKKASQIKPKTPHEEAELLVRWARNIAYKITHSEVVDLNTLNSEQIRNLNIETNMITKLLTQAVIQIQTSSNLKYEY